MQWVDADVSPQDWGHRKDRGLKMFGTCSVVDVSGTSKRKCPGDSWLCDSEVRHLDWKEGFRGLHYVHGKPSPRNTRAPGDRVGKRRRTLTRA